MSCCGGRKRVNRATSTGTSGSGKVASAETLAAAATPRYLVVPRQTSTDGKRFSTLVAAQDFARRSGGIIRQL